MRITPLQQAFDTICCEWVMFHCITTLRVSITKPGLYSISVTIFCIIQNYSNFDSFHKTWGTRNNFIHQWAIGIMKQMSNELIHLINDHVNIFLFFLAKILCCFHSTLLIELSRTLWRHLPIEPLSIFTVVIDHVVVSDPLHLPHLTVTQLAVYGRAPPVSCWSNGALGTANWPIPLACSRSELAEFSCERCTIPVYLHQPASSCPVICIP